MDEPSEAAIAEVCDFTGLDLAGDRKLIVAALKSKSGSVQNVVSAYYDDPSKFRQTYLWDETPFLGDRDGVDDSAGFPTFAIQSPDESDVIQGVAPAAFRPPAPSRPPSRVQSPLSRMADWTVMDGADGPVGGRPSTLAQEDKDLERALAESAAMSGLHTPQETGITAAATAAAAASDQPTDLPFFGPATREAYEPDQWAMVRAAPEPQEVGPSDRKRDPGVPAFLRCCSSAHGGSDLNGILTILHAIPAARNALLRTGTPATHYGQNPEWWHGAYIEPMGGGGGARPDDGLPSDVDYARDFIEEVHRVMAFLDSTDRAYGTADNFRRTAYVQSSHDSDLECAFFNAFRDMRTPEVLDRLFSEVRMIDPRDLDQVLDTDLYALLDIRPDAGEHAGPQRDLYTVLDSIYWADLPRMLDDPDSARMAMLARLAPVQIFRHVAGNPPKPLEAPEFFYADRYLFEHRQQALQMQVQLAGLYRALDACESARRAIVTFEEPGGGGVPGDRTMLSEQAIDLCLQKIWQLKALLFWQRHEAARGTDREFDYSLADVARTEPETPEEAAVLRSIQAEMAVHRKALVDIKKKLARLEAEKEAIEKLVLRLRRKNTEPAPEEDWSPTHRIRLRGVITSPTNFYFARREEVPADGEAADGEAAAAATATTTVVDQWWHVSYSLYGAEPARVVKTTLDAAQQAATRDTVRPTLVYCSDAALEEAPDPLADALRTFVRLDNRYFKQERLAESPVERKRQSSDDTTPTSPSKRQQRSSSMGSMASNMASLGEFSDRDMDDVPLMDDRCFDGDEGFVEEVQDPAAAVAAAQEGPTVYGNVRDNLAGMAPAGGAPETETPLGSEMVQLAIGHAARTGSGAGQTPGLDDRPPPEMQAASGGKPHAPETEEVRLLADWDNPEGRYVGPSGPP